MGTAGYMAPEQVRGRDVDHRADIFALGCVLYEMLGGRRAFHRETAAETMTSVLKDDPAPLGTLGPEIPAALDGIVRHCLEKQPDDRFQSARDLTYALESASNLAASGSMRTVTARPSRWQWAAATVAIAALTGAVVWWSMRGADTALPEAGPTLRAELPVPLDLPFLQGKDDRIIAVSPDGRKLASVSPGHNAIRLRDLKPVRHERSSKAARSVSRSFRRMGSSWRSFRVVAAHSAGRSGGRSRRSRSPAVRLRSSRTASSASRAVTGPKTATSTIVPRLEWDSGERLRTGRARPSG